MEKNSLKHSSIQTVQSIELKFDVYVKGHRITFCVDFSESRSNSFFTGVQKRIHMQY